MDLVIEPFDVWLFRDGRPFTAGENHLARSLFPPSPQTLYGVLRSKLATERALAEGLTGPFDAETLERLVGNPSDFGRFQLRGPWLARYVDQRWHRLVPAPRDVLWPASGPPQVKAPLDNRVPGLAANGPAAVPWPDTVEDAMPGRWIAEDDLAAYLRGAPSGSSIPDGALYTIEVRPGIEIDRATRTTAEGRFYGVEFIRLKTRIGLAIEVEGIDLPPVGLLGIGGEARAGRYENVSLPHCDWEEVREAVAASGRAKLVLATPALFRHGWAPGSIDPSTGEWSLPSGAIMRLEAALVGPPIPIGGFDVVRRLPRPMRRAAPPGSVYYLREQSPGGAAAFFDTFHLRGCSDELAGIGFGLSYVGSWDYV